MSASAKLPVRDTYAGKHVLLTGASGFLGKVWLYQVLDQCPEVAKVYVLLRPGGFNSARQRLEDILSHTPLFAPLHERLGAELGAFVAARVEVLEGDITHPRLGLDEATAARVQGQLDLIVHCAGNVDFDPDLRDAYSTNVKGTLQVLSFAQGCRAARLVHVSTCYVAGQRQGWISEDFRPLESPNGRALDPEAELSSLRELMATVEAKADSPEVQAELELRLDEGLQKRGWSRDDGWLVEDLRQRYRRRYLKDAMIEAGRERAHQWGWRNIYTYTKGLAEALLQARAGALPFTVVRPAIVESSLSYPFPGWNDGYNTSGPILYLLGTWFRLYPARAELAFDVIPVDLVSNALLLAGAALLANRHRPLYQVGSSDRNLFTMGRATELAALHHRRHLRAHGATFWQREVQARFDAVNVHPDHPLRLSRVSKALELLGKGLETVRERGPKRLPPKLVELRERLEAMAKNSRVVIDQTDRMLTSYRPFIYEDQARFESRALDSHPPLEEALAFRPERIDWRTYWADTHMNGLRRWVWPELEGKDIERYQPQHPVVLQGASV